MSTSGVYPSASNYESINIMDLAFIRAGITAQRNEAEHLYVALQELKLLLIEWANRGVNQFMITQEVAPLSLNQQTFTTPAGTIDILKAVYRQNGQDIEIGQISRDDYLLINQKTSQGNPLNYFVDKTTLPPVIYLWPVPNQANFSIVYNRLKLMQDVVHFTENVNTTILFMDALIFGLAARLAWNYNAERYQGLVDKYNESYQFAYDRDGDNANLIIMPRLGRTYNIGGY